MPITPQGTVSGTVSTRSAVSGGIAPSSGTGTKDYNNLNNKPSIESVTLQGNKTFHDLGMDFITNSELEEMLDAPVSPSDYDSVEAITTTELDTICV